MIKDKILGCLYGQAIGNALGLQTEFMSRDEVASHYSPMLRYYNQDYPNGYGVWEDDTKQMLCILDEFVNSKSITASGVAANLLN